MSDSDKLRVVQHFLLAAPPGEFEDVLYDVRTMIEDDDLLNSGALEFFYKYNVEQLIPVDIPDSDKQVCILNYNKKWRVSYSNYDEKKLEI